VASAELTVGKIERVGDHQAESSARGGITWFMGPSSGRAISGTPWTPIRNSP